MFVVYHIVQLASLAFTSIRGPLPTGFEPSGEGDDTERASKHKRRIGPEINCRGSLCGAVEKKTAHIRPHWSQQNNITKYCLHVMYSLYYCVCIRILYSCLVMRSITMHRSITTIRAHQHNAIADILPAVCVCKQKLKQPSWIGYIEAKCIGRYESHAMPHPLRETI